MSIKLKTHTQKRRFVKDAAVFIIIAAVGIIFVLPLIWMVIVTFEERANIDPPIPPKFWIENPSLFNIKLITENGRLWRAYGNSIFVAIFAIAVRMTTSMCGGYALAKGKFLGKAAVINILLATMMIPFEVRMIPMFVMFKNIGWYNTFGAVIFPGMVDAFGIFMAKQYFEKLPDSLREFASIDGLGELGIFIRIYMPLSGPITSTIGILTFLASWNDFLWPLVILSNPAKQTIPLFISSFSMENASRQMGTTMGVSFMSIIPVLILYIILQKYIILSVATSGMKE